MPIRLRRTVGLLAGASILLTACGSSPVTKDDLVSALVDEGEMSQASADCVADRIFDSGDWTQEQLDAAASDPDNVPGFQAAIDEAFAAC